MTRTKNFLAALVLAAAVLTGAAYWRSARPSVCRICDRPACRAMRFGLRTRWGWPVGACCPRCAAIGMRNDPSLSAAYATDFATGKRTDAETAFYVEGSNAVLCHRPEAFPGEVPGAVNYTVYDRCLPSVLAFREKPQAEQFMKEHGGRLISFADLRREVASGPRS